MSQVSLQASELERIAASAGWRENRIEVFDTSMGRVIVKGQRPLRSPAGHRALNAIAALVGLSFLRAVPVHGGSQAQAVEIRRLRALQAAGLPVPEVLHVAPDHFVMRWLGSTNLAEALDSKHPMAWGAWQDGARLLMRIHAAGEYLSQSFARNMIVHENGDALRLVGVIDFEDDPLEILSLPEAQVRDWLTYLQSSLWMLQVPAADIDAALDGWIAGEEAAVQALFASACVRLSWLRHLPASRRFGRDTVAVQAVAAAAHRWRQRHPQAATKLVSSSNRTRDEINS